MIPYFSASQLIYRGSRMLDVRHDNYLKSVSIANFRHLKNYKVSSFSLFITSDRLLD